MRGLIVILVAAAAVSAEACMTLVVGKKVSATGRVIVGHNEDDGTPLWIRHGIVPAADWPAGTCLPASAGCNAKIPQAAHTLGCYWSEVKFSCGDGNADSFLNERGVLVVSNSGAMSKEPTDDPTLVTEGDVKFNLRRVVGERATSARDGARLVCELVEKYGYAQSARIYTVADADEAWMVQVVRGRNYAMARCPDDRVTVMPNVYTVGRRSDFPEGALFFSKGLVENAKRKGNWDGTGEFDFAAAYQGFWPNQPTNVFDCYPNSVGRSHQAVRFLTGRDFPMRARLPFAVKPNRTISAADLRTLLSSHNAPLKDGRHEFTTYSICAPSTIESSVCELGATPKDATLFVALGHGCEKPYLRFKPFDGGLPQEMDQSSTAAERLATHVEVLKFTKK